MLRHLITGSIIGHCNFYIYLDTVGGDELIDKALIMIYTVLVLYAGSRGRSRRSEDDLPSSRYGADNAPILCTPDVMLFHVQHSLLCHDMDLLYSIQITHREGNTLNENEHSHCGR